MSMTWLESVDAAMCFGWINCVRKRIDDVSYTIRFTPRKATSTWRAINIERVRVLQAEGRVREAGLQAYAHRRESKSKIYAYEQAASTRVEPDDEAAFRRNKAAWKFFEAQPPGYRHFAIWRIVSAKRAETQREPPRQADRSFTGWKVFNMSSYGALTVSPSLAPPSLP